MSRQSMEQSKTDTENNSKTNKEWLSTIAGIRKIRKTKVKQSL